MSVNGTTQYMSMETTSTLHGDVRWNSLIKSTPMEFSWYIYDYNNVYNPLYIPYVTELISDAEARQLLTLSTIIVDEMVDMPK